MLLEDSKRENIPIYHEKITTEQAKPIITTRKPRESIIIQ